MSNYNLEELIEKIKSDNNDLEDYILDFKYEFKEKNNAKAERKHRIYIFGKKDNLILLNEEKTIEFFLDSTFKIVPKKFRPYKLLIISGLPINNKIPRLLTFVLIKYLDKYSYDKLFNFLHDNFGFMPEIIHTDFEKSLYAAIKNNIYMKDKTIHTKCFFHFTQMIRKKMAQSGLCKRKINKQSLEILRNIQLLCFLENKNLKKFKDIIKDKLIGNKIYKNLLNYLESYIFKLDDSIYNYSDFFKYIKINDNNDNNIINTFYVTNNIVESINSKINSYLPKHSTNNFDFVNSINKILANDSNDNKKIKRHDFITMTIIDLIKEKDLNNKLAWIKYDDYKNSLKKY